MVIISDIIYGQNSMTWRSLPQMGDTAVSILINLKVDCISEIPNIRRATKPSSDFRLRTSHENMETLPPHFDEMTCCILGEDVKKRRRKKALHQQNCRWKRTMRRLRGSS